MNKTRVSVPILNVWHMLRYAWDIKLPEDVSAVDEGHPCAAENLVAQLLIALLRRLARRGLAMAYRNHVEAMTYPRGRFLVSETVLSGAATRHQVVCERDEMTTDVLSNRAVKAAVTALLSAKDLDDTLALQLRALLLLFEGVGLAQAGDARKALPSARDGIYRRILLLCVLLEETRFVDPERGKFTFDSVAMSPGNLGKLFEQFLKKFFISMQRRLPQSDRLNVRKRTLFWSPPHANLPHLETDICLEGPALRLVIEVKFSERLIAGRFGRDKLPSDHLYQIYSYLRALSAPSGGGSNAVKGTPWQGALVYGRTQAGIADFDAQLAEFQLAVRSIDLSRPWTEVEAQTRCVLESLGSKAGTSAAVKG